jgi:two-component system, NarL family, response regulator LiaR
MDDTSIIRVALLDDDEEILSGLSWMIENAEGFSCVGLYKNCSEALAALENNPPDVMLMDIGLPDKSGIECVRLLKQDYPEVQVLMLTVYSDEERIFESLRAGAVGYLLKRTQVPRLLEAITDAYNGGAPMSGEVARKVLGYFTQQKKETYTADLSKREKEILELLVQGYSYKAIAETLFLSPHTVRFHIHNIYGKLHVSSKAEAVAKALTSRMV